MSESEKQVMFRMKTKYMNSLPKYSSRKSAYKQGWKDAMSYVMRDCIILAKPMTENCNG